MALITSDDTVKLLTSVSADTVTPATCSTALRSASSMASLLASSFVMFSIEELPSTVTHEASSADKEWVIVRINVNSKSVFRIFNNPLFHYPAYLHTLYIPYRIEGGGLFYSFSARPLVHLILYIGIKFSDFYPSIIVRVCKPP